jgi:hypothetical protein
MVELAAYRSRDEEEGVQGRDLARAGAEPRTSGEEADANDDAERRKSEGSKLQKRDELELVAMAKTVGQEGDRNTAKTRRRSRGKARRSHQEVACLLGEARGGPEWPDFAGDLTGRSGRGCCCNQSRLDSFVADGEDDAADIDVEVGWQPEASERNGTGPYPRSRGREREDLRFV